MLCGREVLKTWKPESLKTDRKLQQLVKCSQTLHRLKTTTSCFVICFSKGGGGGIKPVCQKQVGVCVTTIRVKADY